MDFELAKRLKDAGFPIREETRVGFKAFLIEEEEKWYQYPTLSELIEACGSKFILEVGFTASGEKGWIAHEGFWGKEARGSTPEEAVARLWLALNKKKDGLV
jgi:hypothetical protein